MPSCLHNLLSWTSVELKTFTKQQIQICNDIISGLKDDEIKKNYRLKSNVNISTCVKNTISGYIWKSGSSSGGNKGYLSDVDIVHFLRIIAQRSEEICIKTIEAVQIAYDIKEERYYRAKELIKKLMRRKELTPTQRAWLRRLEPYCPSDSWLSHFCIQKMRIEKPYNDSQKQFY